MSKELITASMIVKRPDDEIGIEVDIEGYVTYNEDWSYGQDADGNRGVYQKTVLDVTDIQAHDPINGDDFALTRDERERASEILTQTSLYS